jgi:hypothetical protein
MIFIEERFYIKNYFTITLSSNSINTDYGTVYNTECGNENNCSNIYQVFIITLYGLIPKTAKKDNYATKTW